MAYFIWSPDESKEQNLMDYICYLKDSGFKCVLLWQMKQVKIFQNAKRRKIAVCWKKLKKKTRKSRRQ